MVNNSRSRLTGLSRIIGKLPPKKEKGELTGMVGKDMGWKSKVIL